MRRTAVSGMLSKLRREGLSDEDMVVVDAVFEELALSDGLDEMSNETPSVTGERTGPKVIILTRDRNDRMK